MAGNVSTIDGLGFEEVNQSSYTENISGTNIYTHNSFSEVGSFGIVSGTEARITTIINNQGDIQSNSIENATELFGYRIKAGSIVMGNGASGLVNFKTPFTTPNYFMFATARTLTAPGFSVTGSQGRSYCVSGTYRASGCWLYGGSATVVNWLAIGI